MPFALPLLFLFDLMAAALTFATVASVPPWRQSAITAPVFVFIAAPMTGLSFAVAIAPIGAAVRSDLGYPVTLIFAALAIVSIVVAYFAGLTCRFVFQTAAPRLERGLGMRPFLVLKGAILSGGTLSMIVLLFSATNLSIQIWRWGPRWAAVVAGIIGGLGSLACFLALLRLRNPEQYLPRPLPEFVTRRIYGDTA